MITEDYVSFETAKLLKEKGFDSEDCFAFYRENGEIGFLQTFGDITDYSSETCVIAPTLQMAMKWLREEKHYYIQIMLDGWALGGHLGYYIVIQATDSDFEEISPSSKEDEELVFFDNPEEAAEEAIKYVLENLI